MATVEAAPEPDVAPASFNEVVQAYLAELRRTGEVRAKTLDSKQEALALLAEVTDSKPPANMTKADARRVKDVLLRYPKNRNKLAATKGKPLAEVLLLPGIECIAGRTINVYIGALQTFFGWAVSNGYAADNIFEGTRVKLSKHRQPEGRQAFSDPQLQMLFRHLTENPDSLVRKDDHKWISLTGLLTGMRLNEICQLDLADIRQDDQGLWCLEVTDIGSDHKHLKNRASRRVLPLPERLLQAGFLEFVQTRRRHVPHRHVPQGGPIEGRAASSSGRTRLFPDLPYCTKNGYGRNPGRWFNDRLLPALGMQDAGLVFHSLRHTMATKLARADVPDTQIKAILGHEQQGVTFGTYFHGFNLTQLKAAIDRFGF